MLLSVKRRSKVTPWSRASAAFHSRSSDAWRAGRNAPAGLLTSVSRRRGSPGRSPRRSAAAAPRSTFERAVAALRVGVRRR